MSGIFDTISNAFAPRDPNDPSSGSWAGDVFRSFTQGGGGVPSMTGQPASGTDPFFYVNRQAATTAQPAPAEGTLKWLLPAAIVLTGLLVVMETRRR